jgi:hypothetical protein
VAIDATDAKARVNAFMHRAGLIMETDAARREDLATIGTTMKVMFRIDSRVSDFQRSHLPETELIAAAAIVRPITLGDEPCEVGGVMNAISLLTQGTPGLSQKVRLVKQTMQKMLCEPRWTLFVAHDGDKQIALTDIQIADLWLYADVMHGNPVKQAMLKHISRDERRIAGTVWVGDRILLARGIQQMIVDLRRARLLPG